MDRVKQFEDAFKKRYNRDVEVYVEQEVKNKKLVKATSRIVYGGKEYSIEEHFDENGLTSYVYVEANGKTHKYLRFIDGEIFVADAIGEQNGNSN